MRLTRHRARALLVTIPMAALAAPALAGAQMGATWDQGTAAANSQWQSAAYGNGVFVAIGPQPANSVSFSADGATWTSASLTGISPSRYWQSVWFVHDRFIAFSNPLNLLTDTGATMSSTDGINWAPGALPAGSQWDSVTYGNGTYVAVSYSGSNEVMTSTDGTTWTPGTAPGLALRAVTFGNGTFVAVGAVGAGGNVITSTDGINWTLQAGAPARDWKSVTYGDGLFVAVSADGAPTQIATSPDGVAWTQRTTPGPVVWDEVAFGGGSFVATGDAGGLMSSADGLSWVARSQPNTVPASQNWRALAFGRGRFAALSRNGSGNLGAMFSGDLWTVPGAPTGVRGVARDAAAVVEWNPPASDGGRPITGYRVTATPSGATCTSSGGSCTVTGLSNGAPYTFTVTATNDQGSSAASAVSDPVTPAAPPAPVDPTPAAPAAAPASADVVPPVFARQASAPQRVSFGRGKPGLAQTVAIDRAGSYTFTYVTARGAITPMLPGSTVGSRLLRTTTRALVLPELKAGATVRLRARIAPGAIAGARLRVSFVPDPESLLLPTG